MKTYATLTEDERQAIVQEFRRYYGDGPAQTRDPLHATMIAANAALRLTTRQLNNRQGSEAFAAALTTLVFRGVLKLQ